MDEPCSAIEPVATAKIGELLAELESSYTIVIVTHNSQQAARIANFTAFFFEGRIIDFKTAREIFNKYSRLDEIPDRSRQLAQPSISGKVSPAYLDNGVSAAHPDASVCRHTRFIRT